ncbi:MAG: Uncharacterised protein [Synechococcus sp. MIT S9220]|nr:MAG: Uncharacterised protein [Synechococcus sp. MIT S9220]
MGGDVVIHRSLSRLIIGLQQQIRHLLIGQMEASQETSQILHI